MSDLNREIGLRVSQLRERLGLTREKLGELANISDRFIYDIETGQKGMSAESLLKLSKSLQVTSDYLLLGNKGNSDFSYIIELLKQLDEIDLKSVEKILIEISVALMRKKA